MSKAVLISIKPEWCEKIANGEKTIEVRKNKPILETPFKCCIYCTTAKGKIINYENGTLFVEDELAIVDGSLVIVNKPFSLLGENVYCANGKVIGEFVCDQIYPIDVPYPAYQKEMNNNILKCSCLTYTALHQYSGRNTVYGWHISDLKVYDKPKKLSEFRKTRPPQNWCYLDEMEG